MNFTALQLYYMPIIAQNYHCINSMNNFFYLNLLGENQRDIHIIKDSGHRVSS